MHLTQPARKPTRGFEKQQLKLASVPLGATVALWCLIALSCPALAMDSVPDRQSGNSFAESPAWERALRLVHDEFPNVPSKTTLKLAARQASSEAADILLLDARTSEEFNVSHIKGAVRAGDVRSALNVIAAHPGKSMIVVYCSVGYRSARLADRLLERGVANVYNLEGSLFQWANEGRPLYRGHERVGQVHPFDEDWGQLLDERYWPD